MKFMYRSIHIRDFAPGACSRGTLQEQSSSVCTNDFMGTLHPREQNFHPTKCSTIFNRLKLIFGSKLPGQIEWTWKCSLVCTDTCKMRLEDALGAKPLVCIGLKNHCLSMWLNVITTKSKPRQCWLNDGSSILKGMVGQATKTCNLFCNIAARQVEKWCYALYWLLSMWVASITLIFLFVDKINPGLCYFHCSTYHKPVH